MTSILFAGGKHAQLYAKFRPFPPNELIQTIIKYVNRQSLQQPLKMAVDIGCGSGQSSIVLSPYFKKIIGVDISQSQIEYAKKLHSSHNVHYIISEGNKMPIESTSVDLVTMCQSIHWFNIEEVLTEVNRILKPNGVIAVYGYWIPIPSITNTEKNDQIHHLITQYLHEEKLGDYWDKERYYVQSHYASIDIPFKDSHRLDFVNETDSTLKDYIGYLSTWSSYQKLVKEDSQKASELLNNVQNKLIEILKPEEPLEEIKFSLKTDYFMIMGHK